MPHNVDLHDVCERVGRWCAYHGCGMSRVVARVAGVGGQEDRDRALISWKCSASKADLLPTSQSAGAGRLSDTDSYGKV